MAVHEMPRSLGSFRVEMQCRCEIPQENLALALSGSIPHLGNWNLKDALVAEEVPIHSGRWVVGVRLPAGLHFEYKWVIVWRDSLTPFMWEDGANRSTHVEGSGRYLCAWNMGGVFQPITGNSGFVLSSPPKRNPQLQNLVNLLEEIAQSVNENCERNRIAARPRPCGILCTTYNVVKTGIIRVCSWVWSKMRSLWNPPPPPPPPQEGLGTWV